MVRLILTRLWPVLIPLLCYLAWLWYARRKAAKTGQSTLPKIGDGPWYPALVATLALGIASFILLALAGEQNDGRYIPAHIEGGKLKPAQTVP